jgi:mono/diheme cytochrome c family protein
MKKFLLTLICAVLALSCGSKPKPLPPDQRAQLEKLRQQLQQTLGEKYHEPVPAATTPQLKRGSKLYAELCAGCHGARGDGEVEHPGVLLQQPSNFTDPEQATFFSEQARLHLIRKGIPGTAMMGWEEVLPEDDILSIYLYVRYLYESSKPPLLLQEIFRKN